MTSSKFDDEDLKRLARRLGSYAEQGVRAGVRAVARHAHVADPFGPQRLEPAGLADECWRAIKKNTRSWPQYMEAPNCLLVHVSPEDWDAYWGVETARKQEAIARSLAQRCSQRELWVDGGVPQVILRRGENVVAGTCEVRASFVARGPNEKPGNDDTADETTVSESMAADSATVEPTPARQATADSASAEPAVAGTATAGAADEASRYVPRHVPSHMGAPTQEPAKMTADAAAMANATDAGPSKASAPEAADDVGTAARGGANDIADTADWDVPQVDAIDERDSDEDYDESPDHPLVVDESRRAWLVRGQFCLMVHSGDIVGAVGKDSQVPNDVTVRLDASTFRYVAPKHLGFSFEKGVWLVVDYAMRGTTVRKASGARYVIMRGETMELEDGDVIEFGAERPLEFRTGENES